MNNNFHYLRNILPFFVKGANFRHFLPGVGLVCKKEEALSACFNGTKKFGTILILSSFWYVNCYINRVVMAHNTNIGEQKMGHYVRAHKTVNGKMVYVDTHFVSLGDAQRFAKLVNGTVYPAAGNGITNQYQG